MEQDAEKMLVDIDSSRPSTTYRAIRSSRLNVSTSDTHCSHCRKLVNRHLESLPFNILSTVWLVIALFGPGAVILLDLPDDPWNLIMDIVMTSVMCFFIVELVLRCWCHTSSYPFTFFFWMDILGSVSMVFDISFLLGEAGKIRISSGRGIHGTMLRAARVARVGARAGRMLKPFRWLQDVIAGKQLDLADDSHDGGAKHFGARLTRVLSTRIALLTIILVIGVPLFSFGVYPEDDFSPATWIFKLEGDYHYCYQALAKGSLSDSHLFARTVEDMVSFYSNFSYAPYKLEGFDSKVEIDGKAFRIIGESLVTGNDPIRRQNIVRHEAEHFRGAQDEFGNGRIGSVYFDFTKVNKYSELMHFAVTLFIIGCMCIESFDLSKDISLMVVKPMGKMLETANSLAQIFQSQFESHLENNEGGYMEYDEDEGHHVDELEVLRRLFAKTAHVCQFLMGKAMEAEEFDEVDAESKGVLVDVMRMSLRKEIRVSSVAKDISLAGLNVSACELPAELEPLSSWSLNLLDLSAAQLPHVAMHIMFDSDIGQQTGRTWCAPDVFRCFVDQVAAGYRDNAYHNFYHACDVVASLSRLLDIIRWQKWLSDIDVYALLVASLCHDIGHPGRTNPFLIETGDALALRYNDKSPLENMHCAMLFEILASDPAVNVFKKFNRTSYKQVRGVCIPSILHTDNALHFDMVKELNTTYEVCSDACNVQAMAVEQSWLCDEYVEEVLLKHVQLWLKLFVHYADVANPLKKFEVNRVWAMRVVDECFQQGDEEKERKLPIGMLNDRNKVSRPGAEHGFIVFLVSPLVIATAHLFPMTSCYAEQLSSNLEAWLKVWIEEAQPDPEDVKKRESDVKKLKDQVSKLMQPIEEERMPSMIVRQRRGSLGSAV